MTDTTQPKITRDHEPTTLEEARLEVRENEQGRSGPHTPQSPTEQSPSDSSARRSSPGRKPLFRR